MIIFQHVTAMQNSETIIPINKDPRAPIFGVADYRTVDDFKNIKRSQDDFVSTLHECYVLSKEIK